MIINPADNRNELSKDEAFLKKIEELILSDISREDINLEDLCRSIGYSRSQVHRKLKKITGKPVTRFIREVRLREAQRLLEGRMGSVSEISYRVGFNSPAYFNKCYTTLFGITPGETLKRGRVVHFDSRSEKNGHYLSGSAKKIIAGLTALIVVSIASFILLGSKDRAETSIAVLPLLCHNIQPEFSYLGDALANEILTQLNKVKGFDRIISYTSSSLYSSGDIISVREVGKELNANYIIEGTLERQDDSISINIQIIYAPEDKHIYAELFKGKWNDLIALRTEIAMVITRELNIILEPEEIGWIEEIPTRNIKAFENYLLGNHAFEYRESSLEEAIGYYQAAIDLDADFANAYVGLGKSYIGMVYYGNWPPEKGYMKAKEVATKAMELNNRLAEAHEVMGQVRFEYEWDFREGEKELRKAISLNPNLASSYFCLADLLNLLGRYDESHTYARRAINCDPVSYFYYDMAGYTYYLTGKVDSAVIYLQERIKNSPEPGFPHYILGIIYLEIGEYEKSLNELHQAYSYDSISMSSIMYLGIAYSRNGMMDEAWRCYDRLNQIEEKNGSVSYGKALLLSELDEPDSSLYYLHKTYNERNNWIFYINMSDFSFSKMRSNPEFIEFLDMINSEIH